jgi:lipoprotein-anchoring transpeptidase ErfK/SrfK
MAFPLPFLLILALASPVQQGRKVARDEALRWQVALDRAGFSPGIIDGSAGEKSRLAIAAYQESIGMPPVGKKDSATAESLGIPDLTPTVRYVVATDDLAQIIPPPKDWVGKSKARRLGYTSIRGMLAEKGHCTEALLQRLNPGVDFSRISAGTDVILPNIAEITPKQQAASIEVNLSQKMIRILDQQGAVIGLLHCSVAKKKEKLPSGSAKIISVSAEPEYLFDPKMWPEVKDVHRKLTIPPGPKNPVGLCWIGLSLDGYGIHGTPEPEMIGKTGSHGCFRLTNWDAVRLGKMVRVGTPVRFIANNEALLAKAR